MYLLRYGHIGGYHPDFVLPIESIEEGKLYIALLHSYDSVLEQSLLDEKSTRTLYNRAFAQIGIMKNDEWKIIKEVF